MPFIEELKSILVQASNPKDAKPMSAYMKYKFQFLGIKSPKRQTLLKTLIKSHKEELQDDITAITALLYQEDAREFHYCAIELYARFKKRHYQLADIKTIRMLLTAHAHWDSVDFIAKHIYGQYLLEQPEQINPTIQEFANSQNMWLNRSTILFQLGYKDLTDKYLLFAMCEQFKDSKEFFIQKAIGWALREYGKSNPKDVLEFVNSTDLKPLSKREAIRRLI